MDHRDYMDAETYRMLGQTRQQMISGLIPSIEMTTPAIDVAKINEPALGVMDQLRDQLTRQASDVIDTAIQGNTRLQGQIGLQTTRFADLGLKGYAAMGPSISEQIAASGTNVFDTYFGTGLGTIGKALESLKLVNQPPSIADYLARTNTASMFSFQGPGIAEQLGTRIDTKSLMGLSGLDATGASIAEQWRLANKGALSDFGQSFGSLREALNFEQSLKSSGLAQAVIQEAWKLREDQAHTWAEANLTKPAETRVEEELQADQNLAEVVGVVQRYFVVYLGYTPEQAHNLVRRIVWILLFGTIVSNVLWGSPTVAASIGAISAGTSKLSADSLADITANALIPDGVQDTTT